MKKHVLSFVMAVVMLLSICPRAFAMENAVVNGGKIVIPSLEQLAPNETASYTIEETGGSKAVIEVKKISSSRAAGDEVLVRYSGLSNRAEFYMTISNNRVTDAYDYTISLTGGSYENESLTHTATYGKLSFKAVSLGGLISKSCWLKGTVTGKNNEFTVDWQM